MIAEVTTYTMTAATAEIIGALSEADLKSLLLIRAPTAPAPIKAIRENREVLSVGSSPLKRISDIISDNIMKAPQITRKELPYFLL